MFAVLVAFVNVIYRTPSHENPAYLILDRRVTFARKVSHEIPTEGDEKGPSGKEEGKGKAR